MIRTLFTGQTSKEGIFIINGYSKTLSVTDARCMGHF